MEYFLDMYHFIQRINSIYAYLKLAKLTVDSLKLTNYVISMSIIKIPSVKTFEAALILVKITKAPS